jgi:tripartite-type tricarboxylate transporter receptor subunit TctC
MSYEALKSVIESKDVNVLVTISDERILPQVPSIGEKGFRHIDDNVGPYRAIVGPPNMEPEPKRVIIATAQKVMADTGFRGYMTKMGMVNFNPVYDKALYDKMFGYARFYQKFESTIKKYIK